jgi:hypothetical protein
MIICITKACGTRIINWLAKVSRFALEHVSFCACKMIVLKCGGEHWACVHDSSATMRIRYLFSHAV